MYLPGLVSVPAGDDWVVTLNWSRIWNRRLVAFVDHVFEDAVAGGEDAAVEVDDVAGAELADVFFLQRDVEVPLLRLAVDLLLAVGGDCGFLGTADWGVTRRLFRRGAFRLRAARPFMPSPPLVDGCGSPGTYSAPSRR